MTLSLQFALEVEDDWPPVGSESLPCSKKAEGFTILTSPMFVRDLSAGDVIRILDYEEDFITNWQHITRSDHSTIWLLRISPTDEIEECLLNLRKIGCNTTRLDTYGCYSIDVPGTVNIADVDNIINGLDEEKVASAFPSMRHEDE